MKKTKPNLLEPSPEARARALGHGAEAVLAEIKDFRRSIEDFPVGRLVTMPQLTRLVEIVEKQQVFWVKLHKRFRKMEGVKP